MDELSAGIAQSRRTVALIKVRAHPNPSAHPKQASEITHKRSLWYSRRAPIDCSSLLSRSTC